MLQKLIEFIRSLFKTDAGLSGDVLMDTQTSTRLDLWVKMYADQAPWVDNDRVYSLGLAPAIAHEIARLVTLEMRTEVTGSARAAFLNMQYDRVLDDIRPVTEYAVALGGLVFKPYVDAGRIAVDCIHADQFFPTAYDSNGDMTGCIFVSQAKRAGTIYTRTEYHRFEGGVYAISNRAYASKTSESIGHPAELSEVPEWATLEPETRIENLQRPLFAYLRMPQANNRNRTSPFGVSVFDKAVDLIRRADEQWGRTLWEYEGSELAVDAAESLFRYTENGPELPKGKKRLFRVHEFNVGVSDKPFIETFSPAIRDESMFNGLNKMLRRIEFACGLAYGTLSEVNETAKTATEILMSRQRSYALVADIQKSLKTSLKDLIDAMDVLTTLYGLAPTGKYDVSFEFDDSLVVDAAAENSLAMQEVTAGILRKEVYLMRRYGVTEEQAKEMIPKAESLFAEE